MANGCTLQNSTFFASGERPVICPRPRRLYPAAAVVPFRWNAVFPAEAPDLKPVNGFFDNFLPKTDSTPPFFCGSPPIRSDNPVVHDARFGQAVLAVPVPVAPGAAGSGSGSSSASASSRSSCTRVQYGLTPAAVRVEGFDCLDRESSQSRGVAAFA